MEGVEAGRALQAANLHQMLSLNKSAISQSFGMTKAYFSVLLILRESLWTGCKNHLMFWVATHYYSPQKPVLLLFIGRYCLSDTELQNQSKFFAYIPPVEQPDPCTVLLSDHLTKNKTSFYIKLISKAKLLFKRVFDVQ